MKITIKLHYLILTLLFSTCSKSELSKKENAADALNKNESSSTQKNKDNSDLLSEDDALLLVKTYFSRETVTATFFVDERNTSVKQKILSLEKMNLIKKSSESPAMSIDGSSQPLETYYLFTNDDGSLAFHINCAWITYYPFEINDILNNSELTSAVVTFTEKAYPTSSLSAHLDHLLSTVPANNVRTPSVPRNMIRDPRKTPIGTTRLQRVVLNKFKEGWRIVDKDGMPLTNHQNDFIFYQIEEPAIETKQSIITPNEAPKHSIADDNSLPESTASHLGHDGKKGIADYFLQIPRQQFTEGNPLELLKIVKKGEGNSVLDAKNGYMRLSGDGAQVSLQVALFRYQDQRPLLAISWGELEENDYTHITFFHEEDGRMVVADRGIFPVRDSAKFSFEMPRYGRTIIVRDEGAKAVSKWTWRDDKLHKE